jgi:hypothetical protein
MAIEQNKGISSQLVDDCRTLVPEVQAAASTGTGMRMKHMLAKCVYC